MDTSATPKRLTAYSTLQFPENALRLEDIKDQEVIIVDGHVGNGKFGEYASLDVETPDKKHTIIVTSGMLVIEAIKNAITAEAFPLQAKFTRTGRCWRIE